MNAGWPIRLRRCADELPGLLAAPGEQLRPEVWEGRAAQLRRAELFTDRRRTAGAATAAEADAALLARRADDIDTRRSATCSRSPSSATRSGCSAYD